MRNIKFKISKNIQINRQTQKRIWFNFSVCKVTVVVTLNILNYYYYNFYYFKLNFNFFVFNRLTLSLLEPRFCVKIWTNSFWKCIKLDTWVFVWKFEQKNLTKFLCKNFHSKIWWFFKEIWFNFFPQKRGVDKRECYFKVNYIFCV